MNILNGFYKETKLELKDMITRMDAITDQTKDKLTTAIKALDECEKEYDQDNLYESLDYIIRIMSEIAFGTMTDVASSVCVPWLRYISTLDDKVLIDYIKWREDNDSSLPPVWDKRVRELMKPAQLTSKELKSIRDVSGCIEMFLIRALTKHLENKWREALDTPPWVE